MKKLLTLTTACALLTAPATAVQKCVALDSNITTCSALPSSFVNKTDWMATCTTNNTTITVKGIGGCFANAASGTNGYPTTPSMASATGNMCWCRIISPVASEWVRLQNYDSSTGGCPMNCAMGCANQLMKSKSPGNPYYFNTSIFSNLSD